MEDDPPTEILEEPEEERWFTAPGYFYRVKNNPDWEKVHWGQCRDPMSFP